VPTQAAAATTAATGTMPVANMLASSAAVGGVQAPPQPAPQVAGPMANAVPMPASATADAGVAASPSALAAAIVAMQRSGNNTATLRLDPPGLGELAVHISLSQSAQVNVQLIPSVPQTAQLLNANLMDLRHAMTAAGLTLGQAQVGGNGTGGNESQGQGSGQGSGQNGATRHGDTSGTITAGVTEVAASSGVRAYA
jgi:flagellar hook-length control protein FliK